MSNQCGNCFEREKTKGEYMWQQSSQSKISLLQLVSVCDTTTKHGIFRKKKKKRKDECMYQQAASQRCLSLQRLEHAMQASQSEIRMGQQTKEPNCQSRPSFSNERTHLRLHGRFLLLDQPQVGCRRNTHGSQKQDDVHDRLGAVDKSGFGMVAG